MAEKRMFAKTIVLSDAFLDMPMSARCLYFTLGMLADDDGFVGSPKSIMRQCGATEDDMKILLMKRFVLGFDTGVIVIKHWKINNYLQKDRYHPTTYQEELNTLMIDGNGSYTEHVYDLDTTCIQDVYADKTSQDKPSLDKLSLDKPRQDTAPGSAGPSLEEVKEFCRERKSNVDPLKFWVHYDAVGWKDSSGAQIRNWKKILESWEKTEKEQKPATKNATASCRNYPPIDLDDIRKKVGMI